MPLLTITSSFLLKGIAYRLKNRGETRTRAYHTITTLADRSMFDAEAAYLVTEIFESGVEALVDSGELVLATGSVYDTDRIKEFLSFLKKHHKLDSEKAYRILRNITKSELYNRQEIIDLFVGLDSGTCRISPRGHHPDCIIGVVVCLKLEGLCFQDAYHKLNRMFSTDFMKMYQVSQIYKQITMGQYLQQRTPEHAQLLSLPYHLHSKILKCLDMPARMQLRNTCQFFRKRVEQETYHVEIKIDVGADSIKMSFFPTHHIWWFRVPEGYVVNINGTVVLNKKSQDFPVKRAAQRHLKWLLSLPNIKIDLLHYQEEKTLEEDLKAYQNGPEDFEMSVFDGVPLLKVDTILVATQHISHICRILESVDGHYLKRLLPTRPLHLDDHHSLLSAPQWKQASTCICRDPIHATPQMIVDSFAHFKFAYFAAAPVGATPAEFFTVMIEGFRRQSPTLQEQTIYCAMTDKDVDEIKRHLDSSENFRSYRKNIYSTKYESPNEKECLRFQITNACIWFHGTRHILNSRPEMIKKAELLWKRVDNDSAVAAPQNQAVIPRNQEPPMNFLLAEPPGPEWSWSDMGVKPVMDVVSPRKMTLKLLHAIAEIVGLNNDLHEIRIRCEIDLDHLDQINRIVGIVNETDFRELYFTTGNELREGNRFLLSVMEHQVWFIGPNYQLGELDQDGLNESQKRVFARNLPIYYKALRGE